MSDIYGGHKVLDFLIFPYLEVEVCLGSTHKDDTFYNKLKLQSVFLLFSLQHKTGLPISTYFSAVKLRWLLDNVDAVRQAVRSERAMFGTVDSWIIWVRAAQSSWLEVRKNKFFTIALA